jgi:hydrogenase-4 component F
LFLLITGIVFTGAAIYNIDFLKKSKTDTASQTYFCVALLMFVFAMSGVLLAQHLGLLWVFIEATTLASAPLIYFEKSKASLEATWKYIFICSIGISVAFIGIILMSIGTGGMDSMFFDDLYRNAGNIMPFWLKLSFPFILVGFGTKMGLAPVHAWLPDAHSEAPSPISAMLSGTLLNAALLSILRIFKIVKLAHLEYYANTLFLMMGFLSLFISAVFILRNNNYKRMLAYSSIENMGVILIGIGSGGLGVFAAMLHIIAHSLTKASLFLTSGNIYSLYKTKEINKITGLLKTDKLNGWLWILFFAGISAFPPFPTFLSKFLMIKVFFEKGLVWQAVLFLLLLTVIIYGMGSSVFSMTFGDKALRDRKPDNGILSFAPQIAFFVMLIILGISMPGNVYNLITNAAAAL